jgi:hypothetical protein
VFFEALSKKIRDKKLIRLVKNLFKSGIMVGKVFKENTLGIP